MLTLPDGFLPVLNPLATLFRTPAWRKAQILLVGAVLAPGQRTVASALRVMGLSGDRNYARYHHVLNRAAWPPLQAAHILLNLLIQFLTKATARWCSASTKPYQRNRGAARRPQNQRPQDLPVMSCAPAGAIWSRSAACAGSVSCGWAIFLGPDAIGPCRS